MTLSLSLLNLAGDNSQKLGIFIGYKNPNVIVIHHSNGTKGNAYAVTD
jgi:hypothetical protein